MNKVRGAGLGGYVQVLAFQISMKSLSLEHLHGAGRRSFSLSRSPSAPPPPFSLELRTLHLHVSVRGSYSWEHFTDLNGRKRDKALRGAQEPAQLLQIRRVPRIDVARPTNSPPLSLQC